jgi:excisionase family DNA binding protein
MQVTLIPQEQLEELLNRISNIEKQLSSISKAIPSTPEEYLSNKEFVKFCKVSVRTAQKLRDEKRIPFHQVGRKILYKKSDVVKFLNRYLV